MAAGEKRKRKAPKLCVRLIVLRRTDIFCEESLSIKLALEEPCALLENE